MRGSSRLQFLLLHLCPSLAQHSGDNSTFIPNACIPIHSSTHIHVRHSTKSSSGVEGTEMKRASFINEEEPSFLSSFLPSLPHIRIHPEIAIDQAALNSGCRRGREGGGVKCQVAREKTFSLGRYIYHPLGGVASSIFLALLRLKIFQLFPHAFP